MKDSTDGFGPGMLFGGFIVLMLVGFISSCNQYEKDKEYKEVLIKQNLAEWRIDSKTGDKSFHYFTIESGKVIN